MYGYHGRYGRVDLGSGRWRTVPLPEPVLRRYLGGVGLGTWILHRECPAGVDPLAPEAPLVFAFSPLVGTALTTSAKFAVVAKSPLTGLLCDALSSSHFALAGKQLGVDALVFVGRCAQPSVWSSGELRPTDLWGATPAETERALSAEGRVASIGVAGENGVLFATVSNEGRHAGRGGLGAVMGSKRLKAVVVRGDARPAVADPVAVVRRARDLARRALGPATAKYREEGTVGNLQAFAKVGALPARNFGGGKFAAADALLSGLDGSEGTARRRRSCAACNVGCEHGYTSGKAESAVRLEYETLFALGPLCGVSDGGAVLEAARRCDALGLDTISAGGTIAFAMECGERGLLDGAPAFGDGASLVGLLDDIARRRGLGELLALGSRRAALRIGHDSLDFAPQVKGLELPGYEPRALQTLALGLAVGTRGACHNRSGAYELDFSSEVDRLRGDERAARLATEPEARAALLDSLILCKFVRGALDGVFEEAAAMLRELVGWDATAEELRRTADRIVDAKKAFNVREGWRPADDTLPARLLFEPLRDGPVRGGRISREQLARMVRAYNRARGWTDEGYLGPAARRDLARDIPLLDPLSGRPEGSATVPA
ncbi:MAG: aldehyde ferredoxin oxidoreductase family protein [Myxococcota bacterium]